MRCPACQQPLHETILACAICGFDLPAAGRTFGQPPDLEFPLTDLADALGAIKKRRLRAALLAMSGAFPQLAFAAVLARVDSRVPLPAHAFWLFNAGGLCAPQESGGLCRQVLLELDLRNARAACMIGYGLEPFMPQAALDRIAHGALPRLEKADPSGAILAMLGIARKEFSVAGSLIPQAFGLFERGTTAAAGNEEEEFVF